MKRILLILAFATTTIGAMAQDEMMFSDTEMEMAGRKHSVITNSFWHNWFVQGGITMSSFWSDQESGLSSGFDHGFRNNIGLSLAIGKWFTPSIGLRTKLNGFWGRSVVSEDADENSNKYWTLSEQVMFNMSNMLYGYNETRLYNCIPYLGLTLGRSMTHSSYGTGFSFGLLNTFRLNKRLALNLDVNYTVGESDFDGIASPTFNDKHDRTLNIELGITYNIGRSTWKKTPDLDGIRMMQQIETDAMNAQIRDLQIENEELRKQIGEH